MKYALMLNQKADLETDENSPEFDAEMKRWGEIKAEMREAGVLVAGAGLGPLDQSTTVSSPEGSIAVTDGPYAETKELLFSFLVIDVDDLDAAIAWASKMPTADYGGIEIRPVVGYEER